MATQTQAGKIHLITGGSRGIGEAAALQLARLEAGVVIVARDAARGAATLDRIRAATGRQADMIVADLSTQAGVRGAAREFRERFGRLDVLVNNAGAVFSQRAVTPDGLERTFALNHLAYFLLTNLLIDLLRDSAPSRIVNVASDAHGGKTLDFDDLQHERQYSAFRVYGESKLANILFTHELARRLEGTGVTANCLHPGVVATGFNKNNGLLMRAGMTLVGRFFRSPENGAATVVYLATSPEVEGVSGAYFVDCKQARSSPASYDDAAARRLWEVSAHLTGLADS